MRRLGFMRLIEGYLFRQLLAPTLAASLALGGVALLSQSLSSLDLLVDQRQSILVFLHIVALSLPELLALVLPIAVFVAALLALNRLHVEQELVVCFAAGMSRWKVIAPAVKLATMAALLTLVVNLWVEPWCAQRMREELFRIRTDLAASLVKPGEFTQPAPGLTLYVQQVEQGGVLKNLFIYQEMPDGSSTTYTALQGLITKRNGKPVMVMRNGSNEGFNSVGVLNYLAFDEYTLDLSAYLTTEEPLHFKTADRYLHELVHPDLSKWWEQRNRKQMLAEAHYRMSSPLYSITFMALALWAVLGGPFSRLGYGRRVARAAMAAAMIRIMGFGVQAACGSNPQLNILQYALPIVPTLIALKPLFANWPRRRGGFRPYSHAEPQLAEAPT
ncbi:MAG TPA: LPS export ABC transporter permease LptF [Caulobacteraceae bacterium]|jgi:lipopolysaccharide export system permease protein|nr:LPS export ABC transporter permease LptF [Caulobacteraceae bacterium]